MDATLRRPGFATVEAALACDAAAAGSMNGDERVVR